jgi:SAM-dependent methyltransferase
MDHSLHNPYSKAFYKKSNSGSRNTAIRVLGILLNMFKIRSIADIGCGSGQWLIEAHRLNIRTLTGVDGPWVDVTEMNELGINFLVSDLANDFAKCGPHDLCISLEVAEHLPASKAQYFVDYLCSLSGTVLFSAAIPGQEGEGHINLQWQSYWADRFKANNYLPLDIIRSLIWADQEIPWWYRQNMILYTCNMPTKNGTEPGIIDIVHPCNYMDLHKTLASLKSTEC